MTAGDPGDHLGPLGGRARVSTGNPVYLGGADGGRSRGGHMDRCAHTPTRSRLVGALAILGVVTAAADLTGSRIGLLACLVLVVAQALRSPLATEPGNRPGDGCGARIMSRRCIRSSDASAAVERAAGAPSLDGEGRVPMWSLGLDAVAANPLFGAGPGRFRRRHRAGDRRVRTLDHLAARVRVGGVGRPAQPGREPRHDDRRRGPGTLRLRSCGSRREGPVDRFC